MEKKEKKLAFIWDFTVEPLELYSWSDGLSEALRILSSKYGWHVLIIPSDKPREIYDKLSTFQPDIILGWGSLDRPSFAGVKEFDVPTALCFAGGPTEHYHRENFDLIFVENDVYHEAFTKQGSKTIKAFGTNDNLFRPYNRAKRFDAVYAAAFATWKRHNLFADAVGDKGLAVGKILEHEIHNYKYCVDKGVLTLSSVPYKNLPELYSYSKTALITAANNGGGQRNVLEAMACNLPPIVMADSDKNTEFVQDSGYGFICDPNIDSIKETLTKAMEYKDTGKGREYIQSKYSAEKYADKLYKGLTNI